MKAKAKGVKPKSVCENLECGADAHFDMIG